MTQENSKIVAFHGNQKEKDFYLKEVHEWVNKVKTRSAKDMADEINQPYRAVKVSDCILRNYELYPKELGLPFWLSNLMVSIDFLNSEIDEYEYDSNKTFEKAFYVKFLSACNVGVDYTPMMHKWQIYLLTELIPQQERERENIKSAVELHQKAKAGLNVSKQEWQKISKELEAFMMKVDQFPTVPDELLLKEKEALKNLQATISDKGFQGNAKMKNEYSHLKDVRKAYSQTVWETSRVAYLSILDVINVNVNEFHPVSVDALVNALWQETIINGIATSNNEKEFRAQKWKELIEDLLIMLKEWN